MLEFNLDKMLFNIPADAHEKSDLVRILKDHPEVQFVSFAGLDIAGNDTDERIPVKLFMDDMDDMLTSGIQTDGSSVNLPKIAELNNGKVDMIPDMSVNWYVDYNFNNIDLRTGLPVGTLRIPAFLIHNDNNEVGARAILRDSIDNFKLKLMELLREHPYVFEYIDGAESVDDIEEIKITSATELEFWVRTPDDKADREHLSTSQELKEQYWKRTYGPVRTALEKTIEILDYYGIEMEMGHKEVGGVKSKLTSTGAHDHIMEQLEIDWKFASAMQAADNEKLVKYVVRDVFNQFGLNTTFMAKPMEGVAGSGEHTHLGVSAKLKNGKMVNLFAPPVFEEEFLNPVGFGALMGILKNYEAINPFVSSSTDSLNRLKPGYEAPVCIVTSLGRSPAEPSRNRTILVGLVRDRKSPLATRFELRSPNPKSNTYLVIATCYNAMLDGIKAALEAGKTPKELEASMSKKCGEEDFYLEKDREYRSEKDVFEEYTAEERNQLFGVAPATVWENMQGWAKYPEKVAAVAGDGAIEPLAMESYQAFVLSQWATELHDRILPNYMNDVRGYVKRHGDDATDYDLANWYTITNLKFEIAKDSLEKKSLLTRAREALDKKDYELASQLQIQLQEKMAQLRRLYLTYKRNLF
ncbi:MAG: glutamine synthetase [Firmicutes bacterium]|nr:glutamine synthetase [Bacillota bacterium]